MFFLKTKLNKHTRQRGFVILFAMVVSLIILLISSGMYRIARKQTIIASYTKEAQRAFYVADSALECALYNDISPYITKTRFPFDVGLGEEVTIFCGGDKIIGRRIPTENAASDYTHLFSFRYPEIDLEKSFKMRNKEEQGCAYVLVEKKEKGNKVDVRITSVGFNTCIEGPDNKVTLPNFDDPKLLERRISSSYSITIPGT